MIARHRDGAINCAAPLRAPICSSAHPRYGRRACLRMNYVGVLAHGNRAESNLLPWLPSSTSRVWWHSRVPGAFFLAQARSSATNGIRRESAASNGHRLQSPPFFQRNHSLRLHLLRGAVLALFIGVPTAVLAQGDEIQVYTDDLAPVGVFNLTWHSNYTPNGVNEPAFLYGVFDDSGAFDIEAGIGFGLTDASDRLQFKVIFSRDLNRRPKTHTSITSNP